MEQFAARPETTGTVIRPVQAVTEDIFVWTVRPRRSVNSLTAPSRSILTYLLTYLLTYMSYGRTVSFGSNREHVTSLMGLGLVLRLRSAESSPPHFAREDVWLLFNNNIILRHRGPPCILHLGDQSSAGVHSSSQVRRHGTGCRAPFATLRPWTVSRRRWTFFYSLLTFNFPLLILMLLHALYEPLCTAPLIIITLHYYIIIIIIIIIIICSGSGKDPNNFGLRTGSQRYRNIIGGRVDPDGGVRATECRPGIFGTARLRITRKNEDDG